MGCEPIISGKCHCGRMERAMVTWEADREGESRDLVGPVDDGG